MIPIRASQRENFRNAEPSKSHICLRWDGQLKICVFFLATRLRFSPLPRKKRLLPLQSKTTQYCGGSKMIRKHLLRIKDVNGCTFTHLKQQTSTIAKISISRHQDLRSCAGGRNLTLPSVRSNARSSFSEE